MKIKNKLGNSAPSRQFKKSITPSTKCGRCGFLTAPYCQEGIYALVESAFNAYISRLQCTPTKKPYRLLTVNSYKPDAVRKPHLPGLEKIRIAELKTQITFMSIVKLINYLLLCNILIQRQIEKC